MKQLQAQVGALTTENGRLTGKLGDIEGRLERARNAEHLAFAGFDLKLLSDVGISPPALPAVFSATPGSEAHADALGRTNELLNSLRAACNKAYDTPASRRPSEAPQKPPPKGKKQEEDAGVVRPSVPSYGFEYAQVLITLAQQNRLVQSVERALREQIDATKRAANDGERALEREKAANKALQDRMERGEQVHERDRVRMESALTAAETKAEGLRRKVEALSDTMSAAPLVGTERDPPTKADVRAAAQRRSKATEAEVERLRGQLQRLTAEMEEQVRKEAAVQSDLEGQRARVLEAEAQAEKAAELLGMAEDRAQSCAAEAEHLREQSGKLTAKGEDDTDKIRKLTIELNICKGTIKLLREREEASTRANSDMQWQCDHLREQLNGSDKARATERAAAEMERVRLTEEVGAYRQAAQTEREAQLHAEKELGRLRETERRLDQLQRDFANYTVSKMRQGEEQEEDERIMQEVLQMLTVDLFRLPNPDASTDEVELAISQLKDMRQRLDAQQRQQEKFAGQTRSAKAQIVEVLKRRMNSIQLFAFTAKRAELERDAHLRQLREAVQVARSSHAEESREAEALRVQAEAAGESLTQLGGEKLSLEKEAHDLGVKLKQVEQDLQAQTVIVRRQQLELAEAGTQLDDTRRRLVRSQNEAAQLASPHSGDIRSAPPEVSSAGQDDNDRNDAQPLLRG